MLSFDEARAQLLANVRRVGTERIAVRYAAGLVLARALVARDPLPRFDNSAMDGYAIATDDLEGDGPWSFPVVGESAAGAHAPVLAPKSACRIFTGAPLPARADAILMQEHVLREGDRIRFEQRPKRGAHVRRAGEDMREGTIAVAPGTRLGAGHLALAAMLAHAEVLVSRRPAVTILCTGNELRAPGEAAGIGGEATIPESNSAPLAALASQAGALVRVAAIAADDPHAMALALEDALASTDLLLTVGGVSVGDHDVVRPALERAGVTLDFWRVAMKPGKPLAVGRSARAHVLGLPGNPASAMVTFALFGIPLLRAMQGDARPIAPPLRAALLHDCKRSPERLEFARAVLDVKDGALVVRTLANQSSGAATSLAESDSLAVIPPGIEPLLAGTVIDVVRWIDL
jgi:molybdopterin molybdotransferase